MRPCNRCAEQLPAKKTLNIKDFCFPMNEIVIAMTVWNRAGPQRRGRRYATVGDRHRHYNLDYNLDDQTTGRLHLASTPLPARALQIASAPSA